MLSLATITPGKPEIFAALQGEGASIGRPSVFLRLSRCNLACQWCDTAYTWRFEGDNRPHKDGIAFDRRDNQLSLPEAEVAAQIHSFGQNRLVITGGEPLLQAPALVRMIDHLSTLGQYHVEIETNGSVVPSESLAALVHQYNVSPKLSHSGNPRDLAIRPEALRFFAQYPKAFFKFVVASPDDVEEVAALAAEHALPADRIFLMPEGRDPDTLRGRMVWLADQCLMRGYAMTDRLHIHLSGDTRGT